MKGRAYPLLLPLIDGCRTAPEIAAELQGRMAPEEVHYVLALLEKQGFLSAPCPELPRSQSAYWRSLGIEPAHAARHLAGTPVDLENGSPEFTAALLSWGLRLESPGAFQVVVTPDYRDPPLAAVNRAALASRRPWCLVNPFGRILWLGPIFRPESTACWACLSHRLEQNQLTAPRGGSDSPSPGLTTALHLAAAELAKSIALDRAAGLNDLLLTFDLGTLESGRHRVTRRPQCPVCGDASLDSRSLPILLTSQPNRFDGEGGYRTCAPEQTLARLKQHISPITGIVPSIERRATPNGGSAVFTARCNAPLGSSFHRDALAGRRSLSSAGKGTTPQQSRVSCIAEAVERYSACFQGHEPRILANYAELGDAAVHPADLLRFSDCQYLRREDWNRSHSGAQWIPERYNGDVPIEWVACWSLSSNEPRYLPAAYCYLDYASSKGSRYCLGDSNGCAAGNTIEEAILQGFLELVERDAIAIWWYNRLRRPERDLAAFDNARLLQGHNIHVLDISTDLGIPVFAAVCDADSGRSIQVGFGAHLDERIAVSRAITEVYQTRLWARATASPEITLEKQPQLTPSSIAPAPARHAPPSEDLRDDVTFCIDRLRRHNLEMIVLDLTRPDIDFPVVRVAVPGLRHYQPRYGPGRLYEVPVQLGWFDAALSEGDMNPLPPPM